MTSGPENRNQRAIVAQGPKSAMAIPASTDKAIRQGDRAGFAKTFPDTRFSYRHSAATERLSPSAPPGDTGFFA
jgi:hypothetical protein